MASFDYWPDIRVIYEPGCIRRLGELTKELGGKRVLVVTDPGIVRAGISARAVQSLEAASLDVFVFDRVGENPTTEHVAEGATFASEQEEIDLIVGLGGGSAMDCAKGINFLLTNGGRMADYWGSGKASQPMLPSIGIPTTSGTGSEAQSYALISDPDTHKKMACGDRKARFRIVLLDPELTVGLPREVAAVTGIDALAHAIESYVCTKRNEISQMFSRRAWALLSRSFEEVVGGEASVEARGDMLLGAHLAGAAIEASMLGAAHACANPLTARHGITHGVAVGLMLPSVIRFNGVTGFYDGLDVSGCDADALGERVTHFAQVADFPESLSKAGVKESDLPELARLACDEWTGTFNPRSLDVSDFQDLYTAAFSGQ